MKFIDKGAAIERMMSQFKPSPEEALQKSFQDFLEKGKRAQVGEIRDWKGVKMRKTQSGKWEPVKKQGNAKGLIETTFKMSPKSLKHIEDVRSQADFMTESSQGVLKALKGAGIDASVTPTNIKSDESIKRKFSTTEDVFAITDLKDLVRNTFVVPDGDIDKTIEEVKKHFDVYRVKKQTPDKFSGYSGNILNIHFPNGKVGEIQVNSPEMIFGKEIERDAKFVIGEEKYNQLLEKAKKLGVEPGKGHQYYEKLRDQTGKYSEEEKQQLNKESIAYYDKIRQLKD